MNSNAGNTILGVLVGGAIGATLGILFAPEKGAVTRKMIKDEVAHSTDDLKNKVSHLKETIEQKFNFNNGSLGQKIDSFLAETEVEVEDAIQALERKLADLKSQNKN
ncbi:YtxH domain-containing protein [Aureivirga sp. CE67]|uniref:YtxH domain-containing protein n=1 Tax=Aureivirga sp. CE67 TaxID=1788983 RepID=UPI0018CB3570|nr:YtxH domain-containing protein [Aureivirga sp. CE67]